MEKAEGSDLGERGGAWRHLDMLVLLLQGMGVRLLILVGASSSVCHTPSQAFYVQQVLRLP